MRLSQARSHRLLDPGINGNARPGDPERRNEPPGWTGGSLMLVRRRRPSPDDGETPRP